MEKIKTQFVQKTLSCSFLWFKLCPFCIRSLGICKYNINALVKIKSIIYYIRLTLIGKLQLILQIIESIVYGSGTKHKDFKFTTTNDENEVIKHLKSGGMAIANQGDEYNVFSTNGHFVVLSRMNGNNIEVLDPQMYDGKYDAYSRPKRIVKKTATGCIVSKTELSKATQDRSPAYFLITYTKPKEVKPMPKYPYFTPNATVKAKTKVYADNNRKTQVGSVSKNERVKALFIGPTNACIQYKVTDTVYKVGLIYSKNVKKDKK